MSSTDSPGHTLIPDCSDSPASSGAIESIRFFVLHAEYWISPDGMLREWLRLMLKLMLLIASPTLLLLPLLTLVLWQLAVCSAYLVIMTGLSGTIWVRDDGAVAAIGSP